MSRRLPLRRTGRLGAGDRLVPHARLAGPMPWVIAIMIALTVLAAGAGLALRNVAANAESEIAGGVTVQIVEGAPAERARQAEVAVALLSNREDVIDVRRVPQQELEALRQELECAGACKLHVLGKIHPESHIGIGPTSLRIDQPVSFATFTCRDGKIVFGACEYTRD